MGQITLYLDEETEARLKVAVKESGLSQSRWVAELIREKTARQWPQSVKVMAGAWADLPTAEEVRAVLAEDAARESL